MQITKRPRRAPASRSAVRTQKRAPKQQTAPVRNKKAHKGVFVCAVGRECFWVNNGPVLRDIEELYSALSTMPETQFCYHVRGKKNDFADWVEDVLGDRTLARRLRKAGKVKSAATAVAKRIRELTK